MTTSTWTIKNMFNTMCATIIKTPASKNVRFVIMQTQSRCSVTTRTGRSSSSTGRTCSIMDHMMMNLTSLDAGVLIMVPHMVLNMFFMVMIYSSMLMMSLSTWTQSSRWPPKCHVWHKNQNPFSDQHVLVMFIGPKIHFTQFHPCSKRGEISAEVLGCCITLIELNIFLGAFDTCIFHLKQVLPADIEIIEVSGPPAD